jgi:RNA polymerase sigma-70 factor (ECF subfamily)
MVERDFQALFAQARDGNRDAQGQLLQRHLDALRAFVRLRSGPVIRARESCSDLVQSACREALAQLPETEFADEGPFRAWLCKVAMHKVLHRAEHQRAAKRDVAREVSAEAGPDGEGVLGAYGSFCTPSQDAMAREELERIEAAFDRLAEDDREVIVQARVLGRSHKEIAADLGKSEDAVRKTLSRARARLAVLLAPPAG